ncbi:MAG: DUF664 domain-containing protein [Crocinitomicaceae bacterium]
MKRSNTTLLFAMAFLFVCSFSARSQQTIGPKKGYSPQIGSMVTMLEDLKSRVTNTVQNLSQAETDFLLDSMANRTGAMIMHLASVEKYYQVFTFEGRQLNEEEMEKWGLSLSLGDEARELIVDKPISYYLEAWDNVRKETLKLLKKKDDKWFDEKVNGTNMNNHWAWYHVMEHQANHMGQIRLILKRFVK